MSDEQVRVIMWCIPRTISTALTKCLSAVGGMEVWFEPYFWCRMADLQYGHVSGGRRLPLTYEGNEDVFDIGAAELSRAAGTTFLPDRLAYSYVKRNIEQTTSKYVFVKDMSSGVVSEESRSCIPTGYRHVFLIRHPEKAYTSYRKAAYQQLLQMGELKGDARDPQLFDIARDDNRAPSKAFYQDQHSLWKYLRESGIDRKPIVLDVDDLLANPPEVLRKFCLAVGFPYSDSLMTWDASLDKVDTWKAPGEKLCREFVNFYEVAMKSSCFLPPKAQLPRDQLYADVIRLSDAAVPFYEELSQQKM